MLWYFIFSQKTSGHFDQILCSMFSNLVLGCPLYCLETCTKCLSNTLESNCPQNDLIFHLTCKLPIIPAGRPNYKISVCNPVEYDKLMKNDPQKNAKHVLQNMLTL